MTDAGRGQLDCVLVKGGHMIYEIGVWVSLAIFAYLLYRLFKEE